MISHHTVSLRTVDLSPLQIANMIHQRPVALAHRRLAHITPSSARSPEASLIPIWHELTVLPHTKNAFEMSQMFNTCFIRPTITKVLTRLPSLLIFTVSPQMESCLDPPQTSQSLLSTKDLYVAPIRTSHGDVARLEVFDHGRRTCAGLGDRVLHVRIAEKSDGEVWEILSGPPRDS